jgi:tape measure domain-containing protein
MSGIASTTEYHLSIIVDGQDNASGPLNGVSGSLGNIGEIAGGIISSQIFLKIVEQIKQMGTAAVQSAADYQTMEVGIESLLAREIARGQTTQQMVAQNVSLTAQEKLNLIQLGQAYDDLAKQISDTQQQYDSTANSQGANSEAALKLQIKLQNLQTDLTSTSAKLQDLKDKSDGTVYALESITTGAMSISDALPQARIEAEKLLSQIRLLAIQSPFQLEDIQSTFKMAMAYGYASDEAMDFTKGVLDMAAGVGAGSDQLDRISYNLAQIRMVGKVTALDVRQLAMAGLDLNSVLVDVAKQSGYTISDYKDFNKLIDEGKLKWEDFASSFEKYADTQFGGASKRLSQTWNGMMSNMKDVFNLTMPQLLGPSLEKITGFMNGVMEKFIDFTNSGQLEVWAQGFANNVQKVLDWFDKIGQIPQQLDDFKKYLHQWGSGYALEKVFGITLPPEFTTAFDTARKTVLGFVDDLKEKYGGLSQIKDLDDFVSRTKTLIGQLSKSNSVGDVKLAFQTSFGIQIPDNVISVLAAMIGYVNKIKSAFEDAKPTIDKIFDNFGKFWDEHGESIKSSIEGIVSTIQQISADIFAEIYSIVGDLAAKIIPWFVEQVQKISAWFVENGPLIEAYLAKSQDSFQTFAKIVHGAFEVIGAIVQLTWSIIEPILSGLINIVLDVAKLLMAISTGDWAAAWDALKSVVFDFRDAIWGAIVGGWNTLLGWFGTSFADLGVKVKNWWDGLKDKTITSWTNIRDGIKEKTEAIIDDIKIWIESIITKFVEKVIDFKNAGKNLIQGLWDGLREKFDSMLAWLGSAVQGVVDTAKRILDEHSPSKVFYEIGYNTMAGMGNGVDDGSDLPSSSAGRAAEKMTQIYRGAVSSQNYYGGNSLKINVYSSDPDRAGDDVMQVLTANFGAI